MAFTFMVGTIAPNQLLNFRFIQTPSPSSPSSSSSSIYLYRKATTIAYNLLSHHNHLSIHPNIYITHTKPSSSSPPPPFRHFRKPSPHPSFVCHILFALMKDTHIHQLVWRHFCFGCHRNKIQTQSHHATLMPLLLLLLSLPQNIVTTRWNESMVTFGVIVTTTSVEPFGLCVRVWEWFTTLTVIRQMTELNCWILTRYEFVKEIRMLCVLCAERYFQKQLLDLTGSFHINRNKQSNRCRCRSLISFSNDYKIENTRNSNACSMRLAAWKLFSCYENVNISNCDKRT